MKEKEKELVEKYLAYKDAEMESRTKALEVQKELSQLAPHKAGEIVKWSEKTQKRVGGTTWRPVYQESLVEKRAVLVAVRVHISRWNNGTIDLKYIYDFNPIKKDGGISLNGTYPRDGYEWTGEVHKDYIHKEY